MKIVVLAGGTSTERTVSITSGTGICKALRQKGHQAILVDIFCGVENVDWLGAITRLLGLEEPDPADEPTSTPKAPCQQLEVEVPAGESATVTVQVHVRTT